MHAKTLTFVTGVLLGIVCGEISSFSSDVAMFAILLVCVQGAIYFVERKRKLVSEAEGLTHQFSFSLITILFSFGLFIGIVRVQLMEEKVKYVCESTCSFNVRIISSPEEKNEYQIFKAHPISAGSEMYDIQIRTTLYPKYKIGETLKVGGKVTVINTIVPHDDSKNNNKIFDYASYLRTKNIGSEMIYPSVEVVDGETLTFSDVLGRWKEDLVTRIDKYVSQSESSLASGMLFGKSSISKDLLQTFRVAGLSHIMVLSGFNIVIVIASILFVLAFLPLVIRITLASISVVVFVLMVGAEPSVIRAMLMSFVGLLAMLLGRAYVARQALIISLFAIVMYEPYALLHDVSLHLSFLATMGLVYMSEPFKIIFQNYFSHIKSVSLKELLITTLSAYFSTLPYVMYTFGTVSPYAIIANILVIPFVPLTMLLSFLVVVSSYISGIFSTVFGFVDTLLISFIIFIAKMVESLPLSSFVLNISFLAMCVTYLMIIISIKYILSKQNNETRVTIENGNLTDIISY